METIFLKNVVIQVLQTQHNGLILALTVFVLNGGYISSDLSTFLQPIL